MPITRHHSGRWLFQFNRVIPGAGRQRANRLLPPGWTRAQALEYEQKETARLYALASGVGSRQFLIEDSVLEYLKGRGPDLKSLKDITSSLRIIHPYYAGKTLDQLPEISATYIRQADVGPATIHHRLSYLRSACRWAWKHKGMGEHDPGERMLLPSVRNARHIYLTREQVMPVFRSMGLSWSRDAARVAFYTGWRIGEVLRGVPLETPSGLALSIPDTKNGAPKIVPVHHKVEHLVRRHWPPQVTTWTVSKDTKAALRDCGLGHARLHDLRHSAASEMINSGFDLYTVGAVLGHKSVASTARYAHLAHARLRDAVGAIGGKKMQPEPKKRAA